MSSFQGDVIHLDPMIPRDETNKDKRASVSKKLPKHEVVFCGKLKIKKETLLVVLTVAGVCLGLLIGSLLRLTKPSDTAVLLITFPGEILMRMLKMLIIPIIITSVITGLANLDMKKSGKMGAHAAAYYLSTTTLAVILGMLLVSAIQPGNPRIRQTHSVGEAQKTVSTLDTFLDLIRNLFPDNIIAACFQVAQTKLTETPANILDLAANITNLTTNASAESEVYHVKVSRTLERIPNTNILGIIVFCIFFGIILSNLGSEGKPVKEFFSILNTIFMKMIVAVIWYSPIGICSLIAGNLVKMGSLSDLIETLGLYMLTVIVGLTIHGLITLPLIFYIVTRTNAYRFYAGVFQAWLTALGTASSAGTLPLTMQCLEENLKIDKRVTQFVLPLGATMNMDGTALLEGVAAITIAQMYQYSLTFGQLVTISVTATLASVGAAAIPSAGLITLLLVLSAIGVPTEAVGLLWSIDWFLDRLRTSVNVLGDCIGAGIVQHLHKNDLEAAASPVELMPEEGMSFRKSDINDDGICDSGLVMSSTKTLP
ncbi:unnamed protein product [Clavelina lepadiformis]|uniref:Amino acid transporter n=1 Tax=Clavelina lepadiformis TaxID=159417 RepID=A0ABP0FX96_CLALP